MTYVVENIDAYLECKDEQYSTKNPLHISFECSTIDGRKRTEDVFKALVNEGKSAQNKDDQWSVIGSLLEARLIATPVLMKIEVRESITRDDQKGSILTVPDLLFNKQIIDSGEQRDFKLLLTVSRIIHQVLPEQLEHQASLARM